MPFVMNEILVRDGERIVLVNDYAHVCKGVPNELLEVLNKEGVETIDIWTMEESTFDIVQMFWTTDTGERRTSPDGPNYRPRSTNFAICVDTEGYGKEYPTKKSSIPRYI
jgi:hypothetical protein